MSTERLRVWFTNRPPSIKGKVVAGSLALIILLMATPRIAGPLWWSIMRPADMREIEGHRMQWEGVLLHRSIHAMLTAVTPPDVISGLTTDEYRALLPIYTAVITTRITSSLHLGMTFADLFWWWLGSLAVVALARRLGTGWVVASVAGFLTASSPLAAAFTGTAQLHTASSLALPVAALLAWDAMNGDRRPFVGKALVTGFAIFLSSVTYTYQWTLIPWLLGLSLVARRPGTWFLLTSASVGVFVALSMAAREVLRFGGLTVHPHLNDPVRIIMDRTATAQEGGASSTLQLVIALATSMLSGLPDVVVGTITSYHPLIALLAVVGTFGATRVQNAWLAIATVIALAQGTIYGVPWVLMSAFPLVYISAANGSMQVGKACSAMGRRSLGTPRGVMARCLMNPLTTVAVLTTVATAVTNLDLIGDATFVIQWWGSWYMPH